MYEWMVSIYYLGKRETDIAVNFEATETDKFFAGSVTCYGSNENGNISFNVTTGLQVNENKPYQERNEALFKHFFERQCRDIVAKDKDAKFFPYSLYYADKVPQEYADRIICMNDRKLLVLLNSKIKFKKFIKGKLPEANFIVENGRQLLLKLKDQTYPNEKEVVIQTEFGEGGRGTVLYTKENAKEPGFAEKVISDIDPDADYVVSDYIKNICSVGISILIADKDIVIYPPSTQLLKGPRYAGSDMAEFNKLPDEVKQKCRNTAMQFGKIVQNHKPHARGFLGIDAIVTESNDVFVVETNPRFTGATGLLNILSHKSDAGSVYEQDYRCFTGEKLDIEKIENITPMGRKRYAAFKSDNQGSVHSQESEHINREGFDKVAFKEDEFYYSHTVFEEIKKYNTFDDRDEDRKYISHIVKKQKI